jgi:hypothetical protein
MSEVITVEPLKIRKLRADEIDCRILTISEKGFSVALYKNARVDMKILDETFGIFGWKRTHQVINNSLFCDIAIWDNENKQWVTKQDVGKESNMEKEKGQASDSFKRAGTNVGIGRELYTAPFIWIKPLKPKEVYNRESDSNKKAKWSTRTTINVSIIEYNDEGEISSLTLSDQYGKKRFEFDSSSLLRKPNGEPKIMISKTFLDIIMLKLDDDLSKTQSILNHYGVNNLDEMTLEMAKDCIAILEKGEQNS